MATREWMVTTESVKQSAERVKDLVAKYETEYQKLYAEVETLRSSKWQGMASDTFNQKLESYRESFVNLKSAMDSYYNFLVEVAAEYEKVEENVRASAGTL